MPIPQDTATFLLSIFALLLVSVVGYLTKRAFTDLTEGVRGLGGKIDTVQATIAGQNTLIAVLTHRVEQLEKQLPWVHRERGE